MKYFIAIFVIPLMVSIMTLLMSFVISFAMDYGWMGNFAIEELISDALYKAIKFSIAVFFIVMIAIIFVISLAFVMMNLGLGVSN